MCLIITKLDKEHPVPDNHIENSVHSNSNGAGVAYVKDGRVVIDKIVGSVEELLKFSRDYNNKLDRYVMHHRLTTHGATNVENAHPFVVLSKDDGDPIDLVMVHNGIINTLDCGGYRNKEGASDTSKFVSLYLQPILKKFPTLYELDVFRDAWCPEFIGSGSKLVFLDSNDKIYYVNAKAGTGLNGVWYSNTCGFTSPKPVTTYYGNNYTRPYTASNDDQKKSPQSSTSAGNETDTHGSSHGTVSQPPSTKSTQTSSSTGKKYQFNIEKGYEHFLLSADPMWWNNLDAGEIAVELSDNRVEPYQLKSFVRLAPNELVAAVLEELSALAWYSSPEFDMLGKRVA